MDACSLQQEEFQLELIAEPLVKQVCLSVETENVAE